MTGCEGGEESRGDTGNYLLISGSNMRRRRSFLCFSVRFSGGFSRIDGKGTGAGRRRRSPVGPDSEGMQDEDELGGRVQRKACIQPEL